MTTATIIAGDLTANLQERVVSGLLLPFGEVGSTNLGRFEVPGPGVFEIPPDVSVLMANEGHNHLEPRARFLTATETPAGIVSAFKVGENPEGTDLMARIEKARKEGKPMALSVEVKDVVIRAGKAISGKLTGAAFVDRGAFPSAALLAAAADTEVELPEAPAPGEEPVETTTTSTDEVTDTEGVTHKRTTTTTTKVETDAEGNTTTTITETQVLEEPGELPADQEEATVANATVPSTLAARAAASTTKKDITANDVFEMMTKVMTGQDTAGDLLAALTDIKISGAGQLPTGGSAVQPSWLGEVWSKKPYERRYIPLITHGDIVAIEEKGFSITTGDEPVKAWNGNKAEMPTTSGTTAPITGVFQRWAVANDIAREFYDIPAGRVVIEAYIRLLVNSYSKVTDYWLLEQMVTGAGAQIAAETYPAEYSAALGKVIQAIDLVDDTDADPSFVVVAADVWKDLRYTPFEQIPQYISFGFRRQEGTADGNVTVVRDKAGKLAEGQVLAGGRDVAHLNELPGASPLQLDALDIAHGGIDKAFLGYTQYMTDYADGLVLVGDPVGP